MERSGLLKYADLAVKLYRAMVEQLESDPEGAQTTLLDLNEVMNHLAEEVVTAEGKLKGLAALRANIAPPQKTEECIKKGTEADKFKDMINDFKLPKELEEIMKITRKK